MKELYKKIGVFGGDTILIYDAEAKEYKKFARVRNVPQAIAMATLLAAIPKIESPDGVVQALLVDRNGREIKAVQSKMPPAAETATPVAEPPKKMEEKKPQTVTKGDGKTK